MKHGGARNRLAEDVRKSICIYLDRNMPIVEIARITGVSARRIEQMKNNGTGTINQNKQICYAEGCTNPPVVGHFCAKHELAKIPAAKLAKMMAGRA